MLKRRKHGNDGELETRLRSHRAQAREEFVEGLSASVSRHPVPRQTWSRLAFASAVSVFILGTFASFGGLGYAASGASHGYRAVKQVASGNVHLTVHKSSAGDEYGPTKKPKATVHKTNQAVGVAGVQTLKGSVKTSGSLPFTGLSLVGTLLLSLLLIASGVLLRRRESSQK